MMFFCNESNATLHEVDIGNKLHILMHNGTETCKQMLEWLHARKNEWNFHVMMNN